MRRRIALLIDDGRLDSEKDVAGRYWFSTVMEMSSREDVELITLGNSSKLHERLTDGGVRAHALGARSRGSLPLAIRRLSKLLGERRPELLHAHEVLPSVVAAVARNDRRTPLLFHRHHARTAGIHARLSSWVGRRADVTVAVSEAVAGCAHELDRTPQDSIRVVLNGALPPRVAPEAEIAEFKRWLDIAPDSHVLCVVARLRPEKGHVHLFEAMPRIQAETGRPVHLLVVGDGPMAQSLSEAADRIPAPIHLLGHSPDPALAMAAAHVIVQPSLHEPFGLSVIEAMALGKPVVATRVDGIVEVVSDETGLLVPPGSASALAEVIVQLLKDPGRQGRLGAAGRQRYLERFTLASMVDGWRAVYDEVHHAVQT